MFKTLFNINLYHSYFLDDGELKFFEISDKEKRNSLEKQYDLSGFLTFEPTRETKQKLEGYEIMVKNHKKGVRLLVDTDNNSGYKLKNKLPEDLILSFYLKVHDPLFYNYSDISQRDEFALFYLTNKSSNFFKNVKNAKELKDFEVSKSASNYKLKELIYDLENQNKSLDLRKTDLDLVFSFDRSKLIGFYRALWRKKLLSNEENLVLKNFIKAFLRSNFLKVNLEQTTLLDEKLKNNERLTQEERGFWREIFSFYNYQLKGLLSITNLPKEYIRSTFTNIEKLFYDALILKKKKGIIGVLQLELFNEDSPMIVVRNKDDQFLNEGNKNVDVHVDNKKTYWRYKYKKTGELIEFKRKKQLPLTKNGTIKIEKKDLKIQQNIDRSFFPNATPDVIKKDQGKYISEILI